MNQRNTDMQMKARADFIRVSQKWNETHVVVRRRRIGPEWVLIAAMPCMIWLWLVEKVTTDTAALGVIIPMCSYVLMDAIRQAAGSRD